MATFKSGTRNGYYAILSVTEKSQSIANNQTELSYTLTLYSGGYYFSLYTIGYSVFINGVQVAYHTNSGNQTSMPANSSLVVCTGTTTVTHGDDGTKTGMAVSFEIFTDNISYLPVSLTASGTMDLTTIPRASAFTLSAAEVTLDGSDGSITATITPASASYSHKLKIAMGSYSAEQTLAAGTKTAAISLPMALLNQIPSAVSGTAAVTLTTYNGNTALGSVSKNVTIRAGDSIVPTISAFTATRVDNGVPSTWGIYVQGYSKATLATTAAGAYGSTIKTYAITGGLSGSTVTTGVLTNAGENTWTVTVTDSRGRTASKSVSVTVAAYVLPTIVAASFERCDSDGTPNDDGNCIRCSTESIIISSCNGKNSKTAKVQYRLQGVETWTDAGTYTSGTSVYACNLSDNAYEVRLAVSDQLNTVYASGVLDIGEIIAEYYPDSKCLEIVPVVHFTGGMTSDKADLPAAFGTENGWYWRKWASGLIEAFGEMAVDAAPCTTALGTWYRTDLRWPPDFPAGLFPSAPNVQYAFNPDVGSGSALCWTTGEHSTTRASQVYLIRPTSATISGTVSMYAVYKGQ